MTSSSVQRARRQRRDLGADARSPGDLPDARRRRWQTTRSPAARAPRLLLGGDGNDSIDGNGGNDVALHGRRRRHVRLGSGRRQRHDRGRGTAPTRCSSTAPTSPSRSTCRRTGTGSGSSATSANITMDTAGVERVDFNALGGADLVTVNDLSGTDVTSVNVDLAPLEADGDRRRPASVVERHATATTRSASTGTPPAVAVAGLRGAGGDSAPGAERRARRQAVSAATTTISAAALAAQAIALTLDGGAGDDDARRRPWATDTLLGGDGNDTIDGSEGNDVALMGAGDDTFVWDPGDGSDIRRRRGRRRLRCSSTAPTSPSRSTSSANGNRARFFRDIAQHHDGHRRRRADRLPGPRRGRPGRPSTT